MIFIFKSTFCLILDTAFSSQNVNRSVKSEVLLETQLYNWHILPSEEPENMLINGTFLSLLFRISLGKEKNNIYTAES